MCVRSWIVLSTVPMLAGIIGCSGDGIPLAEVTGRVTFNGQPAPAEIFFQPHDAEGNTTGRPSIARADDDGEFRVSFTASRRGAVVGQHRISVNVLRRRDGEEPRTYHEATAPLKTVKLERMVKPGRNHFDFAITY